MLTANVVDDLTAAADRHTDAITQARTAGITGLLDALTANA